MGYVFLLFFMFGYPFVLGLMIGLSIDTCHNTRPPHPYDKHYGD